MDGGSPDLVDGATVVLRPVVSKSILKGTLAVAVFSVFLEIGPRTFVNYLIFLAICYALMGYYAYSKHASVYTIDDSGVTIRRLLRAERRVGYDEILDLSFSRGRLAKRFRCGTVYLVLKDGKSGGVSVFGGGSAEALRDVREPEKVIEEISSRLSPYFAATGTPGEDLR